MRALEIKGMRVERAGNAVPADVRIRHQISPADYVVIDGEANVLSDPQPTFTDAALELYHLAEVEIVDGLPVFSSGGARNSSEVCYVRRDDGSLFLHDPECMHRLGEFA
ncbi:hypothetical protein [Solimonas marina]|uniref:Uncharacterized protein n=1 Tax=Solimonas marina TaxID=2714601 RepID=A0A970B5G9_9GAMM|nr:hypothetical protein [Solimonas marina]NKF21545.1 hypothetical protein [Solimonas marina]